MAALSLCVPPPQPQPIVPFSLAVTSAMMDDRIPLVCAQHSHQTRGMIMIFYTCTPEREKRKTTSAKPTHTHRQQEEKKKKFFLSLCGCFCFVCCWANYFICIHNTRGRKARRTQKREEKKITEPALSGTLVMCSEGKSLWFVIDRDCDNINILLSYLIFKK